MKQRPMPASARRAVADELVAMLRDRFPDRDWSVAQEPTPDADGDARRPEIVADPRQDADASPDDDG